MIEPVDWKHRADHMRERHGVLPEHAEEAVRDFDAVWFDPDPKSRSGRGVRLIGYSHTAQAVLTGHPCPQRRRARLVWRERLAIE